MKPTQRIVFFDLDGTLHKQDLFGCYLRYCLARQPVNLLPVILFAPVIIGALLVNKSARWPVSLLLWAVTVGHSEKFLQQQEKAFCQWAQLQITPFPAVLRRLYGYLQEDNTRVWLVTGSPQSLVEGIYGSASFLSQVSLIGSQMQRRFGGRVLSLRCFGRQKVIELEQRIGCLPKLYSGYSDSNFDTPLMNCCQYRWRITASGSIQQLD
ncbi:hypothetical protein HA49_17675 [Tatumella morbirosei]|uniref:Acid phosphatase AphA n=1 Tax=Tatumella morbirosei TaxID=642227 RepID=A0A095T6J3_9GAMM|nr:phosphatidylglycerophosphatase C [Tatumella morbirosei]KGD72536.1 hypothetical protein HA49_17675 [Tatumella morbirosei]